MNVQNLMLEKQKVLAKHLDFVNKMIDRLTGTDSRASKVWMKIKNDITSNEIV
jgi:hypothetical protein